MWCVVCGAMALEMLRLGPFDYPYPLVLCPASRHPSVGRALARSYVASSVYRFYRCVACRGPLHGTGPKNLELCFLVFPRRDGASYRCNGPDCRRAVVRGSVCTPVEPHPKPLPLHSLRIGPAGKEKRTRFFVFLLGSLPLAAAISWWLVAGRRRIYGSVDRYVSRLRLRWRSASLNLSISRPLSPVCYSLVSLSPHDHPLLPQPL